METVASASAVPLIINALLLVNKSEVRATVGATVSKVTVRDSAVETLFAASVMLAVNTGLAEFRVAVFNITCHNDMIGQTYAVLGNT